MQVTFRGDNIHLIMDKMCYFHIFYWLFQNSLFFKLVIFDKLFVFVLSINM